MKRQTDGPTKGERMSTTYDGMVPAHILTVTHTHTNAHTQTHTH